MTEQPSGADFDNPAGELQPLVFQPIADHGQAARYEALAGDQGAPGSPVLAVTLTIASSVQRDSPKELQALLGGMEAAFTVLPELPPDDGGSSDGGSSDEEPFDISKQLLIELSLTRSGGTGTGPVAVAVTVETTAGAVPAPAGSDPTDKPAIEKTQHEVGPQTVGANLDDVWVATFDQALTATVRAIIGEGTIRNPPKSVYVGHPAQLTGKKVIVHAGNNHAMRYSLSGYFIPPKS